MNALARLHDLAAALAPALAWLAPLLALVAAALVRRAHARASEAQPWLETAIVALSLAPLAAAIAWPEGLGPARAALAVGLCVALLAHDPRDLPQTETALKLAWVMGAAFALSWAGDSLLAVAAGGARTREQWAVLALALDPYALWSAALSLGLLAGLVLLGGAPFHFWPGDLFHGARAHLAPFVATTLQLVGAAWLLRHLEGIGTFHSAAHLVRSLLTFGASIALAGGAATLGYQRRPERKVGAIVSLQGGLVLAALAAAPERALFAEHGGIGGWAGHLLLASTGAGLLSRFLPVTDATREGRGVLFRRHPVAALAGGYALLSLAGAPGTPGMSLWLDTARTVAETRHPGLLVGVAMGWLAAIGVAVSQLRGAFAAPRESLPGERPVPGALRAALALSALGLALMLAVWRR